MRKRKLLYTGKRTPLHTTLPPEVHKFIANKQIELDMPKNEVIIWLVYQHKKNERLLQKQILKEVVHQVLHSYYREILTDTVGLDVDDDREQKSRL